MTQKRNLIRALDRANVKHANKVVTFLFIQIAYMEKRHGDDKGFWLSKKTVPYKDERYPVSTLIAALVGGGFVTRRGEIGMDRSYLYPTDKLLNYYHGHLGSLEAQLREQQAQLKDHSEQLAALWKALKDIHDHNPPVTPEKLEAHLRLVRDEQPITEGATARKKKCEW
jgi:hypothetical protein